MIRWTDHALDNLTEREIDPTIAESTLNEPEFTVPDSPGRTILMRRYQDRLLQQPMVLRIVIEENDDEIAVVTVYKTSQLRRYLQGLIT